MYFPKQKNYRLNAVIAAMIINSMVIVFVIDAWPGEWCSFGLYYFLLCVFL